MAADAFAHRRKTQAVVRHIGRLRIDVTLQAQEPSFAAQQQVAGNAAMRTVASCATFDLDCRMFEHVRAAFLGVATDAAFPIRFPKHRLVPRTMRTVAVRTFHQTFGNSMVAWESKLGLDHPVT